MSDLPSLNTAQKGVKIFSRKIWGWVLAILGGLYTLLGATVLLLWIGFKLVQPQQYYALPSIYLSIDWTVAVIISALYLVIGILSLIFGIRQVGWGKKHHWGWDMAALILFLLVLLNQIYLKYLGNFPANK